MEFSIGDRVFYHEGNFSYRGKVTEVHVLSDDGAIGWLGGKPYDYYMTSFSSKVVKDTKGEGHYGRRMFKEGQLHLHKDLIIEKNK